MKKSQESIFFGTPTKSMVGSRLALSKYIFEFLPAGNSKFTSYYPSHKASEKGTVRPVESEKAGLSPKPLRKSNF